MLSLSLARTLKQAGLKWSPSRNDFFAVPDRDLDDEVFVITPMSITVTYWRGREVITFQGSFEWALDYIVVTEVVWLPTEAQLRAELERRLLNEQSPSVQLRSTRDGYVCTIAFQMRRQSFEAFGASEAYAAALLHVLEHQAQE